MKRTLLIVVSFIPGAFHILVGRTGAGTVLMVGGFFGANVAVLGLTGLWQGDAQWIAGWTGLVVALIALVTSVVTAILATSGLRQQRIREASERSLREACTAWLQGRPREAEAALRGGLGRSAADPDLLFVSWQIALDGGDRQRARKLLRRLERADVNEKWRWEIDSEERKQ